MAYEIFKRTGARVETPTLSITLDGRIAINAAAVRVLKAAAIKNVLLMWDEANHKLAVKATHKGDTNAYTVSVAPDNHSGSITAKSFLTHIGWSAPHRQSLPAIWNEREKMFEVELPASYLVTKRSADTKLRAKRVIRKGLVSTLK